MALIQTTGKEQANNVATSSTFNAPGNFTAGNDVILALVHYQGGGNRISGITVSGTAGTRVSTASGDANNHTERWLFENIAGGDDEIIVTYGGGADNFVTLSAEERNDVGVFYSSNSATGTSTAPTVSLVGKTAQPKTLTYASFVNLSVDLSTITEPGGWTQSFEELVVTGSEGGAAAYIESTSVTALTAAFSVNTSIAWAALIDSFTILDGPTISVEPTTQEAAIGGSVTYNITASASKGALSYQWKFNGANVGSNSSSYTRSTLVLADNLGEVTCVVTDDLGSRTSRIAYTKVTFAAAGTGPRRRSVLGSFPIGSWGPRGVFTSTPPGGFQAAWARGSNVILGGGNP